MQISFKQVGTSSFMSSYKLRLFRRSSIIFFIIINSLGKSPGFYPGGYTSAFSHISLTRHIGTKRWKIIRFKLIFIKRNFFFFVSMEYNKPQICFKKLLTFKPFTAPG